MLQSLLFLCVRKSKPRRDSPELAVIIISLHEYAASLRVSSERAWIILGNQNAAKSANMKV